MEPKDIPQKPDMPETPEEKARRAKKQAKEGRIKEGLDHPRGHIIGSRQIMPGRKQPVINDSCDFCDYGLTGQVICPICRNCQACGLFSTTRNFTFCHLCGNVSPKQKHKPVNQIRYKPQTRKPGRKP